MLFRNGEKAMAFQPVPNTAEIVLRFTAFGQEVVNVLHAHKSSPYTSTDIATLAAAVDSWVNDSLIDHIPSTTAYVGVTVTGLAQQNDFQAVSAIFAQTGQASTQGVANNITKAFSLRSGVTGRSARGRFFFPTIAGQFTDANANHVLQGFVDDVIDILSALITVIEAIGWILSVVSRYNNGVKRTQGINFDIVSIDVTDLTTDSARGRMVLS